ncbi:putative kinase inhibitor [Edwardsiella tarda]|nr:putative kinase inhibitor [Edwardsiella tarda]
MFAKKALLCLLIAGGLNMSAQAMTLTSPTVENGQSLQNAQIFNGWGCSGKNLSPRLKLERYPRRHQEFRRHHV